MKWCRQCGQSGNGACISIVNIFYNKHRLERNILTSVRRHARCAVLQINHIDYLVHSGLTESCCIDVVSLS